MLKFTELFRPDTIRHGMIVASKKRLFETLSEIAAKTLQKNTALEDIQPLCFDWLVNREKLGNSCLGAGVAMPKARIPADCQPVGIFIQLETPIDYEAADKREVDLVFAVFIPENQCAQFIPELPQFAEQMVDKSLVKQLRAAQSADEIWQVFQQQDQANQ